MVTVMAFSGCSLKGQSLAACNVSASGHVSEETNLKSFLSGEQFFSIEQPSQIAEECIMCQMAFLLAVCYAVINI